MQKKYLYEYAVIRILPRVEREEFINAGLILFSKKARYIRLKTHLNEQKLVLYASECDQNTLLDYLAAWEKIASGSKEGGYIATLEVDERFRWLTAIRSSCIQTSRPHPGYTDDLDETFHKLFTELVL